LLEHHCNREELLGVFEGFMAKQPPPKVETRNIKKIDANFFKI
jgi:hypothetical protein